MTYNPFALIQAADSPSRDSFGRFRVSQPVNLFDSQMTYDLQPLLFEQITNGSGATITHDSTNRNVLMTFSSTPTGGKAYMQSYEFFRYQPGKCQKVNISFNFIASVASCLKFAGYSDGTNGIEFQNNGSVNQFVIYSATTNGNQTATQANWNLDKLNGSGRSGLTLDITQAQILVMDMQALYTGRVRIGFDIGGTVVYCHEFLHSNATIHPYIQTANLPVRVGMTCTGTVSTTMKFTCSAVESEGGSDRTVGFEHSQAVSGTAGNDTAAHVLSLRPKTTFNSITNRTAIRMLEVNVLVVGANPVLWELCLGQAISGTTTFNDVNTTYSSAEYNSAGTISGSPLIRIDSGYIPASNQLKGSVGMELTHRYPITLDAAGAVRALGTISLIATGIGGTSAIRASMKWVEVR